MKLLRQKIFRVVRETIRELLLVRSINRAVFSIRFFYYVKFRHRFDIYANSEQVIGPEYSIDMLQKGKTSDRPLFIIRPLSVIQKVDKEGMTLSVGCRFETELFYLVGYGFKKDNIRGLDMISYSPWVDIGNMHSMPYQDESWDTVILGWVMAYSDDPSKAASEVVRVGKQGAVVAVALSYYPEIQLEEMKRFGSIIESSRPRIQTVDAILSLFNGNVGEVFFRHDAPNKDESGVCSVIFSLDKQASRKSI